MPRFEITNPQTGRSQPLDAQAMALEELCRIRDIQEKMVLILGEIRDAINKNTERIDAGIAKSDEALEESKWVRLHLHEVAGIIKEDTAVRKSIAEAGTEG